MSTPAPVERPPHVAMRALATNLRNTAAAYRQGWHAQRGALDAWESAEAGIEEAYGMAPPQAVADALTALDAAAEAAQLLNIRVDDKALAEMEKSALLLEVVAAAADKAADAILAEQGGVQ